MAYYSVVEGTMDQSPQKWSIVETEEYGIWFESLDPDAQDAIAAKVGVLKAVGPSLGRPAVDSIKGSRFPNMKELRVKSQKRPFRIFFAFDPERQAVLLVGGNKAGAGDKTFYAKMIPLADKLFREYLEATENEKRK